MAILNRLNGDNFRCLLGCTPERGYWFSYANLGTGLYLLADQHWAPDAAVYALMQLPELPSEVRDRLPDHFLKPKHPTLVR